MADQTRMAGAPNDALLVPPSSAVSWAAVLAGTVVAASTTLILMTLGTAFGLASISPWDHTGISAGTFTVTLGIWLILVQWMASGLGGYITGRLRTRWVSTHAHEVFFRDTAHGLVMWSLSAVVGATIIGAAGGMAAGAGSRATAIVTGGAATAPFTRDSYQVDALMRPASPAAATPGSEGNAEVARILAAGVTNGTVSADDRVYLSQIVSARTGVAPTIAQKRVDDVIAQEQEAVAKARQVADEARKAAAASSLFLGISMLVGAFIAAVAAAFAGTLRDEHP